MPAKSTDSKTLQRAAVPRLTAFIEALHAQLVSEAGDVQMAVRGDVAAARGVLERFAESEGGIVGISPDDWALLGAARTLVARLVAQPDTSLRAALGYQHLRADDAGRIRDRVVYFAVDHAMFGMAEVRTEADACRMVSEATRRLPSVFSAPLTADTVGKVYRNVRATDPGGPPSP